MGKLDTCHRSVRINRLIQGQTVLLRNEESGCIPGLILYFVKIYTRRNCTIAARCLRGQLQAVHDKLDALGKGNLRFWRESVRSHSINDSLVMQCVDFRLSGISLDVGKSKSRCSKRYACRQNAARNSHFFCAHLERIFIHCASPLILLDGGKRGKVAGPLQKNAMQRNYPRSSDSAPSTKISVPVT
ncbi:hypothetical protein D3C73_931520 [compost metagenome]